MTSEQGGVSSVAAALANLIVGNRMVVDDPVLGEHPSLAWVRDSTNSLWRALGFSNAAGEVVLGLYDSPDAELLDEWPADARQVAIAYDTPIYAIQRVGVELYSARLHDGAPSLWASEIGLAFASLCVELNRVCTPEALSRLP